MNKILKNIKTYNIIFIIILTLLSCIFMYNGYKSLSGYIANGFKDGMAMLTIILCFFTPVFSFLFFFYEHYIKKLNKIFNIIYSSVSFVIYTFILSQIFIHLDLYVSNNKLGAYETLLPIGLGFPYDGIIIYIVLMISQIYNIFATIYPKSKYCIKESFTNYEIFNINSIEYLFLSFLAIFAFIFVGSFLIAFKAIDNALYDPKYLYLMLFVLIPMMNLLFFVIKPETKNYKLLYIPIIINILFGLLLLLFELIYPSFIVSIGKPLFPVTFSISLPIECLIILIIMLVSILIYALKIVLKIKDK